MEAKLAGVVKFKWQFLFELLERNSQIREYIVLPLVYANAEYQVRESELIKTLQAKDKELEDYRAQGVKLSRSELKIKYFSG